MIKIPKQINYIQLYYTLRCNLSCSYCINDNLQIKRKRQQLKRQQIVKGINKIQFKDVALTLGGGEATLRKDFYQFVNLLRNDIKIDLLTNLTFDENQFVKNIKPQKFFRYNSQNMVYKSIRVSYHPKYMDRQKLVNKVSFLQQNGYSIGIFGISHPLNMQANTVMSQIARKNKVYFFIKDFLGWYGRDLFGYYLNKEALNRENKKNCKCRSKQVLIDSSGNIYRCHRDLYSNQGRINNILNNDFKLDYIYRDCNNFGQCNPCDLKIKLNRFLDMGHRRVEIE